MSVTEKFGPSGNFSDLSQEGVRFESYSTTLMVSSRNFSVSPCELQNGILHSSTITSFYVL